MLSDAARQYHQLYEKQSARLLYAAPWWLDVTCGKGQWGACVLNAESSPSAIAFHTTQIRGMSAVITPPLTQWMMFLSAPNNEPTLQPDWLAAFPKSSILDLNIKNMPGGDPKSDQVRVSTRYSFILPFDPHLKPMEGYNEGLRRNLKQAEAKYHIRDADDAAAFIQLCKATYAQRREKTPWYMDAIIPALISEIVARGAGRLRFIYEADKLLGGILTAWDDTSVYYIAGGRVATDDGTSAHSLLMHDAIREAQKNGKAFDFEGSMVPGIANFFQSFGAKPAPYGRVRKFRGMGRWWALWH